MITCKPNHHKISPSFKSKSRLELQNRITWIISLDWWKIGQDILIVAGDFKAKVGEKSTDNVVASRFGQENRNEVGDQLLNFCSRLTRLGESYRNDIDCMLIRKRWITCV